MPTNRVRSARKSLGLSQVELAAKANVSQPVISHLERGGAVGKRAGLKVHRALGGLVSIEWLLGLNRKVTVTR